MTEYIPYYNIKTINVKINEAIPKKSLGIHPVKYEIGKYTIVISIKFIEVCFNKLHSSIEYKALSPVQ